MPAGIVIAKDVLEQFARATLIACGASEEDAVVVATSLVWSDLIGRAPQGVFRLPVLARMLDLELITSPARHEWTEKAPAVHHLDAGNGFGQVAGVAALARATTLARACGVGVVTVSRSNHYGACSYFCALAAESGCLALTCTNASPKVAPWGGTRAVLGTNPLAFGFPTSSGHPVLVDLSTAAIAGSTIRILREAGQPLPEGVAVDADGRPTRDPADVNAGCLLPAAGPKGFGLGLMVETLSALLSGAGTSPEIGPYYDTGTRTVGPGHFFLVADIDRFRPMPAFLSHLDTLVGACKAAGADVRIPGEMRGRHADDRSRNGIPLDGATVRLIEELSGRVGVPPPWLSRSGG